MYHAPTQGRLPVSDLTLRLDVARLMTKVQIAEFAVSSSWPVTISFREKPRTNMALALQYSEVGRP